MAQLSLRHVNKVENSVFHPSRTLFCALCAQIAPQGLPESDQAAGAHHVLHSVIYLVHHRPSSPQPAPGHADRTTCSVTHTARQLCEKHA